MTLEGVSAWINKLPEIEREVPIMTYKGRDYTPLDILREVKAGTAAGRDLQSMLGRAELGTNPRKLAKERLLRILAKRPVEIETLLLGKPRITAEELRREIETEGDLGTSLIETEMEIIAGRVARYRR